MDQQSFLFQATIYLAASVVMVPIAKRMGLGSVLGYLLAGMIIGPFALGFIGQEGKDLMHAAEFGVVMMLFLIGLELEPALLWRLRKSILGLGGLQVGSTTLVLAAILLAIGLPWQSALALGMLLGLSSTAIVLQTFNEKGLMQAVAGKSAFAVLLFQDIAVIPMLAIFPLLSMGKPVTDEAGAGHGGETLMSHLPGWGQFLLVLATVGVVIAAGRFVVVPMLRLIAKTRLREMFTAASLLVVVSIAVLMLYVGLSPALGTFLAGVVLANSEFKHELESDIEPFKGLLLGLFFIAVGASVDFDLIMSKPLLVLGLVVGLMVVKGAILWVLGRVFGMGFDQNAIFSFSLSQAGEFGFVLISFSLTEGILPRNIGDMATSVIAISMAFTPLVFLVNEKWILPLVGTRELPGDPEEAEAIEESNPVIIAGFGHFGSTIGRMLRAHHIGATVLEIDSDQVNRVRRMGILAYYGDACRHELLESAGAHRAKIIVIAIGQAEKRLELIETVKKHFPNLRMYVRSTDRYDAYDLMNAGMMHIYRETLDTSVRLAVDVMKTLGYRAYHANRAARTFIRYDERKLRELASIHDDTEYVVTARRYIEEIESILRDDMKEHDIMNDEGWEGSGLIKEANRDR